VLTNGYQDDASSPKMEADTSFAEKRN
jgi:hypothetical protein